MIKDSLHQQWLDDVDAYLDGRTTPEELEARGQLRAREVLRYVQERSAFYAGHLRSQLGGPSTLPALDGIPFTTKEDLRAVGRSVCSLPFDQIAVYYETTGTTGLPTPARGQRSMSRPAVPMCRRPSPTCTSRHSAPLMPSPRSWGRRSCMRSAIPMARSAATWAFPMCGCGRKALGSAWSRPPS